MIPKEVQERDWDIPQWHDYIDRLVFDEIDRYILKRKFTDNISIEKIAQEIGLSDRQTKRRYKEAKKQLFKRI